MRERTGKTNDGVDNPFGTGGRFGKEEQERHSEEAFEIKAEGQKEKETSSKPFRD